MDPSLEESTSARTAVTPEFGEGVSVGVIVRNEERDIERCLKAIDAQADVQGSIEILLIDNASTDATLEVVERVRKTMLSEVKIIRRAENNLGAARDQALKAARFKWIAFTDADCMVPPNWLHELKTKFIGYWQQDPRLAAIGTCNEPPLGQSRFQDALRLMFTGFLGHLNSPQARHFDFDQVVDHLPTCSVLYDRQAVLQAGGFSALFDRVCEDVDLSTRLRSGGRKLMMISSVKVTHVQRSSHRTWFKKVFRYGWGRTLVMRRTPKSFTPTLLLPPLFIFMQLGALSWSLWWLLAFGCIYGGALAVASSWLCQRHRRWDLWWRILVLHSVTHFAYALGMIWGSRAFFELRGATQATLGSRSIECYTQE